MTRPARLRAALLLCLAPCGAWASGGAPAGASDDSIFDADAFNQPALFNDDGYRTGDLRSPIDAPLPSGGTVIDAKTLRAMLDGDNPPALIDVLPRPVKPANFPPTSFWRVPKRHNIPGSVWLPNIGEGSLSVALDRYFVEHVSRLSEGGKRGLVFYCLKDCWMSWNAARRALKRGYARVYFFPGGTDEWRAAGFAVAESEPLPQPAP